MKLKPYEEMKYYPITEQLLTILRNKTMNTESDLYFRILGSFFLSQMASNMRTSIDTPHRGLLPTNMFACCLATSGAGKGHSINILEDFLVKGFKKVFLDETMPLIAENSIDKEAARKANLNATDFEEEKDKLSKEYSSYGAFPYVFDSGTAPAFKQVRTKAQIANIGALTMVCDEIGTNLLNNSELFAVNLEAYDIGKIKQKITKNTNESKRGEERDDPVPSNMLIFGTPSKLFNGAKEEQEYYALLETGYARRLFFAVGTKTTPDFQTAEEVFKQLTAHDTDQEIADLHLLFSNLGRVPNYNRKIVLSEHCALINIEYQLKCERAAAQLSDYEGIRKAELQHRYFKALKLAGVYAFIDSTPEITEDQMYAAIKLTEDSGEAFSKILTRDKNYARLAKYICACKKEVTHADICEDLAFYPTTKSKQEELLTLAIAWGHKNNVIIKRTYDNTIEFFKGETLEETSLDNLTIAYSTKLAHDYINKNIKFSNLEKLTQTNGIHWVNHHVLEGHRSEDTVISGFNLLVIDCDGGISLSTAMLLLAGYQAAFYTTKRHTAEAHRFRVILPMKYTLKLNAKDYKEFMFNLFSWLPFPSDESTGQRCKKWLSQEGTYETSQGELFDPLPFIPKTQKNLDMQAQKKSLGDLTRIEQFFAAKWLTEGRNNTLIRYGLMLRDSGIDLYETEQRVREFNLKHKDPLSDDEINNTVMKTLAKSGTKNEQ
jgi:hypothetical protein